MSNLEKKSPSVGGNAGAEDHAHILGEQMQVTYSAPATIGKAAGPPACEPRTERDHPAVQIVYTAIEKPAGATRRIIHTHSPRSA